MRYLGGEFSELGTNMITAYMMRTYTSRRLPQNSPLHFSSVSFIDNSQIFIDINEYLKLETNTLL